MYRLISHRTIGWLAALLGGVTLAAIPAAGAIAGTGGDGSVPSSSPVTKAEAIAKPSVVYIETHWKGYVWVPPNNGANIVSDWYGPFTATLACSGYVASSTGYVVTAGHCVDNQSMTEGGKAALITVSLARAVARGTLTQAQADALWGAITSVGKVEGRESGSPPERTVKVFQPTGTTTQAAKLTADTGLTANVIDYKSLDNGDVGLLKVQPPSPMPAMQVAGGPPDLGSQVISAGYPGAVADVVDSNQQPSFKSGTVSSTQTVAGVPFIETNADNTAGMSGGPTFNLQGRVVGTVSFGPAQQEQAFNFITDTTVLKGLLTRNGVPTTLSAPDLAYRNGLDYYYSGRYHDAVAEFDKVLAVEPDNATAAQFRAQAIALYPQEASGFPWLWVGIAIGAVVLVGAGVAFLLIRRGRARPGLPAGAPGPVPTPSPAAGPTAPIPPAREPTTVAATPAPDGPPTAEPGPAEETPVQPAAPSAGIFCPNCGTPHSAEAHFCESCGRSLARVDAGRPARPGGQA